MMSDDLDTVLQEVSNLLWRERDLLDAVAYKLEMERLVLASEANRWLARATRELDGVLDQLRSAELVRSLKVDDLAGLIGLRTSPTLRELAAAVPEPWDEIFLRHRDAFVEVTTEIRAATAANRSMLTTGRAATRAALTWLGGPEPVARADRERQAPVRDVSGAERPDPPAGPPDVPGVADPPTASGSGQVSVHGCAAGFAAVPTVGGVGGAIGAERVHVLLDEVWLP